MEKEAQRLVIFDFDGTLFASPCPKRKKDPSANGWWQHPCTLEPPVTPLIIPASDEKWWSQDMMEVYRNEKAQGSVIVVVTGREEYFRERISTLLTGAGILLDDLFLKPRPVDGSTNYKVGVFCELLQRFRPKSVVYYDDREQQAEKIKKRFMEKISSSYRYILSPEDFELVLVKEKNIILNRKNESKIIEQLEKDADFLIARNGANTVSESKFGFKGEKHPAVVANN